MILKAKFGHINDNGLIYASLYLKINQKHYEKAKKYKSLPKYHL